MSEYLFKEVEKVCQDLGEAMKHLDEIRVSAKGVKIGQKAKGQSITPDVYQEIEQAKSNLDQIKRSLKDVCKKLADTNN